MIKREIYMDKIRPFIDKDLIKVLTGMRRCGKSVMLQLIQDELKSNGVFQEQIISFNFEMRKNMHLNNFNDLYDEIIKLTDNSKEKFYLFFDEIQEVTEWEKCINALRVDLNCDIYITGSNAKLLSGELATYLAGRYVEFIIYPFSFNEFKEVNESLFPNIRIDECFRNYITMGGMPYLVNLDYNRAPSEQYLKDIYNSIVLKDIVTRNNVRDTDLLERIISYVLTNVSTVFSSSSIEKYFKSEGRGVSKETILNYIKYCMDAFLFYRVKRQDLIGKQILTVNEKYYVVDHGIREAVVGGNQRDIGMILENIVYLEMLRRGYHVTVGKSGNKEIDFVCETANEKMYVQVSYLLASNETIEREFGVYKDIKDNYTKYVISLDEFDMSRDGIKHMNIRDFLLKEEWI